MTKRLSLHKHFGSFLSDGDNANVFRFTEVEPVLSSGKAVVLDFRGVTNMTTSFSNALVATLFCHFPNDFHRLVRFENCEPVVKDLLLFSIAVGRKEAADKQLA